MSNLFHELAVCAVSRPTVDTTSVSFEIPSELASQFRYSPGQYLTVKLTVKGEELVRCYSLNSSPFANELVEITIKRVKGGRVSNYIADNIKKGDIISCRAPAGKFFALLNEEAYKSYFLFAAGSGITPIFSIVKSILLASPHSAVYLLYGNRDQKSIIFKGELEELENKYPQRFNLVYTLSKPSKWASWKGWEGRTGRIDAAAVEWFIRNNPPVAQQTEYYVCGPGGMNNTVKKTLIDLGIPSALVFSEYFEGDDAIENKEISAFENARVQLELNNRSESLVVQKGRTILEQAIEQGVELPYSCQSGVCGTCVAKLKEGTAEMKSCMALSEEEIANGSILTCQALPTSPELKIEF